jgi:hypothetical protein
LYYEKKVSTIPPISTKLTITSHLNSFNIRKKELQHMTLEIQVFVCDRNKKMADLNQLIVSQLFPLDNWISKGNTGIDKR